jgi:hypothetical protein
MIPNAVEVRLSPEDRAVLEARLRAPTGEQRQVFRARVVLLAADGRSTRTKSAGEILEKVARAKQALESQH